jgi:LysR family glycine cleavage system transcriptional activator/LysR family transcriptional regulator of beta-lactamase
MKSLPPLNGLRAFEAAARHGGFAKAGAELNVSPSAISRLVKLLEDRLKVALFVRRPNGLELTERGAIYLADLTAAFDRIVQATERVRATSGLVIGAGPTLAMRWLIPRLVHFHDMHPKIEVRISTAIERAEPLAPDWTAAIRRGDGAWPGLTAQFLFKADLFPVCAPAVARALKSPADLARARILAAANAPDDWPAWLRAAKVAGVDLRRAQRFDYPAYTLQAAADGLGVAMARAAFVADDLAAGRLVRPFTLTVSHDRGWYLVHRPELTADPALAAFRTWVITEATASSS